VRPNADAGPRRHLRGIPSGRLALIQGAVRTADQLGHLLVLPLGDADRDRHGPPMRERLGRLVRRQRFAESLADVERAVLVGAGQDDQELLAAPAADRVLGPERPVEDLRGVDEHGVTNAVTEPVVDRLEVVEVDDEKREGQIVAARGAERIVQVLLDRAAVAQAGERIDLG